ncbi:MAG TPA: DUF433 domain-containing protein [Ktedonobacterales bacterium]|nr:DUF433 domain-containing protein [Ktedonobacterales bacterium]
MEGKSQYVTFRNGNWYVGNGRVELYSVIASWQQGYSPEETRNGFPHLELRAIYGAILFYLEHRDEMDAFFHLTDDVAQQRKQDTEATDSEFFATMRERIARYLGADRDATTAS